MFSGFSMLSVIPLVGSRASVDSALSRSLAVMDSTSCPAGTPHSRPQGGQVRSRWRCPRSAGAVLGVPPSTDSRKSEVNRVPGLRWMRTRKAGTIGRLPGLTRRDTCRKRLSHGRGRAVRIPPAGQFPYTAPVLCRRPGGRPMDPADGVATGGSPIILSHGRSDQRDRGAESGHRIPAPYRGVIPWSSELPRGTDLRYRLRP